MIRKIRPDEYLERYDAMSDGERRDYQRRVGEWLAGGGRRLYEMTDRPMAKAQNIMQLSMRWGQDDCQAFQDGARLLSALIDKADTWLPTQLYAKGAYRAVRQMCNVLGGDAIAGQQTKKALPMIKEVGRSYDPKTNTVRVQMEVTPGVYRPAGTLPAGKPTGTVVHSEEQAKETGSAEANSSLFTLNSSLQKVPPRPTHIDQYAHLLPVATQERAKEYGPLMRQLEEARENLRLVADDPKASDKDRERWAKAVAGIDKQIGSIKRELDSEWEKLAQSGRVVVDDLGMAHVVDIEHSTLNIEHSADATDADGVKSELNSDADAQAAKEKQELINALRRWLRDCRTSKNNQKHLKHWREKYLELVALGGPDTVTDAVKEAAKFYGFDLTELDEKHE